MTVKLKGILKKEDRDQTEEHDFRSGTIVKEGIEDFAKTSLSIQGKSRFL
jgi:hypothetical protein